MIVALAAKSSSAASTKPTAGENSSDLTTPSAWPQSTPLVPEDPEINWFITPTPMIEPISACELEFGMPNAQVPRFQMIAAINKREHHREACFAPDLQDQLYRQQ